MNIVRIITALIIYLIYAFAEWDFNISNWGFFARLTFITLVVISAIGWWVLGVISSASDSKKKEEQKQTQPKKSTFQQRLEELAEERKRNSKN